MFKIRALATLALIIGGAGKAIAQNPADYYEEIPRAFYGGLVVGANFAQVDGDNYAGYHRIGINAGGIVYTKFDEHLAASIEILYSQKGSHGHFAEQNAAGHVVDGSHLKLNRSEERRV